MQIGERASERDKPLEPRGERAVVGVCVVVPWRRAGRGHGHGFILTAWSERGPLVDSWDGEAGCFALWAVVRAIHRMGQNRGVDGEDVSRRWW